MRLRASLRGMCEVEIRGSGIECRLLLLEVGLWLALLWL